MPFKYMGILLPIDNNMETPNIENTPTEKTSKECDHTLKINTILDNSYSETTKELMELKSPLPSRSKLILPKLLMPSPKNIINVDKIFEFEVKFSINQSFKAKAQALIDRSFAGKSPSSTADVISLISPLMILASSLGEMSGKNKKDTVIAILKSFLFYYS